MNRRSTRIPRSGWRGLSALALSGWVVCQPLGARAEVVTNLPPTSRPYGLFQYQRLRFRLAPLLKKADRAIAAGDYRQARETLEAALRLDPGQNAARVSLLEIYARLGEWPRGLALAEGLVRDHPSYLDGQFRLGLFALRSNQPERAVAAWQAFVAQAPTNHPSLSSVKANLAEAHFQAGRFADAVRLGEEARRGQDSVWLRCLLAECYLRLNQPARAREVLPQDGALPRDAAQAERVEGLSAQALFALGQHAELARLYRQRLDRRFARPDALGYFDALAAAAQWSTLARELERYRERPEFVPADRHRLLETLLVCYQKLPDDAGIERAGLAVFQATGALSPLLESAKAGVRLDHLREASAAYAVYLDRSFEAAVAMDYFYLLKRRGDLGPAAPILARVGETLPAGNPMRTAALYELALLRRFEGRKEEYLRVMGEVVRTAPTPAYYLEYGSALHEAGRLAEAVDPLEKALAAESQPEARWRLGKFLATTYLELRRPEDAERCLRAVAGDGSPDFEWSLAQARVAQLRGDETAYLERLLPLIPANDRCAIDAAQLLLKRQRPGLALNCLKQVKAPERLTAQEQYYVFANRAWLYLEQGLTAESRQEIQRARQVLATKELFFFELALCAAEGRHEELRRLAQTWLERPPAGESLSPEERSRVLQFIARTHLRDGQGAQTVSIATDALPSTSQPAGWYFLRGQANFQVRQYTNAAQDFARYTQLDTNPPAAVYRDWGRAQEQAGDHAGAAEHLRRYLSYYPYDIALWEEHGYLEMKRAHNAEAKRSFAHAIDLRSAVAPYLPADEAEVYRTNRLRMKQEYTKLDKVFGFELDLQRNEYDLPGTSASAAAPTVQGALPSWAGIEASYRPPVVGFRNERTFDVFGRVLGTFRDRTWELDDDSYQAGFGVRYRPFRRVNYRLSFERLVAIGRNAEDNWLWRNLAGWEHASLDRRLHEFWFTRLYGEFSHYVEHSAPWFLVVQGQTGPSWLATPSRRWVCPEFTVLARQQWDDPTHLGSYQIAGLGSRVRLLEPERTYTFGRWSLEGYVRYDLGRLSETPAGWTRDTFHGLSFGLSLTK